MNPHTSSGLIHCTMKSYSSLDSNRLEGIVMPLPSAPYD